MRLHLVDGTYELFRAYYSKRPPHRAPDGSDKKATVAPAFAMLALLHEEALLRRRGIGPSSIPDLLALTGDDADGIPGLPGFGEKSASALLAKFIHLEQIPANPATWPAVRQAQRLAATLGEHRADALLYRRLATLRTDAPIGTLEDAR